MTHSYLDWIDDAALIRAVRRVHATFVKEVKDTTLRKITENVIDPFTAVFETGFLSQVDIEQWVADEAKRQIQKTLTNELGAFHQAILGAVDGWTDLGTGHPTGLDLVKDDGTVFAEIKNKYNTLTGARQDSVFRVLERVANTNPEATCYFVHMVRKRRDSYDELWQFKAKDEVYAHERVRLISGDSFYDLVAGDGTLSELFTVLPSVINDHITEDEKITMGEIEAVQDLKCVVGETLAADKVLEFLFNKAYPNSN